MDEDDFPEFPLLQLPEKALKNAIQWMDPMDKLALSTCHPTLKSLIRIPCRTLAVLICSPPIIDIDFNDTCGVDFLAHGADLSTEFDELTCEDHHEPFGMWTWDLQYTFRGWIEHLMVVLDRRSFSKMTISSDEFSLESIKDTFKGFPMDYIYIDYSLEEEFISQVLKALPPTDHLEVEEELSSSEFSKINIQNFGFLDTSGDQKLTFDDILINNSVYFKVHRSNMTPKGFNRFVKLWILNGTNLRMKYLKVKFEEHPKNKKKYESDLLKGLKYQENEEDRTFDYYVRTTRDGPYVKNVTGGFNIHRMDGTEATIKLEKSKHREWFFKMFIWS